PPERPRENIGVFEFMSSSVSSEKPAPSIIRQIALDIMRIRREGGRIVVVAGPAVVHTGAADFFARFIAEGYVDALLAGNALAVHDVEAALFGTSLGVSLRNGVTSMRGHRNHMAAINAIFEAGSLEAAVRGGLLNRGIMFECIRRGVPYVLAGSIRDDGPVPDTICDMRVAQDKYKALLKGARMVIMLSTMLHAIAVGNMLPSNVKIACVDINPAVVTKLLDRGTTQAVGVVSDVGTFLPLLLEELHALKTTSGERSRF
ncbi:MAG: TIGR00300 family protein, partial [Candidatus Bathyarchaeia archaeon]